MKVFSCKVHEKQTTECAEQCRANLQKINSVNLHTAAVALSLKWNLFNIQLKLSIGISL